MKKSIFLFFAAILCAMSVSAKVIYFKPNGNWAAANAAFYANVWGGSGVTNPVKFTPVANDATVYEAEVGTNTSIIFLRMDPSKNVTSSNMWTSSNDGGPLWNRMGDLSIPADKNCCTIKDGQWTQQVSNASSYVTWSTYTPSTTAPNRYLTGTLAGGWNANDVLMTYDEENEIYTHTFTSVAADEEHKFKVTDGTWSANWGGDAVSPAIDGVTKDGDGNVVFTLSVGGDVTVTFDGSHIQLTTTGSFTPVETFDYYVVGSFNGWNTADAAYGMTKEGDVYKKEVTFAKDAQFKVCDGTWGAAWGAQNLGDNKYTELDGTDNIVMKEEKTFTIIFNPAENLLTFEGLTPEAVVKYDYYLIGTINGWALKDANYGMTDENADGVYEKEITLAAGDNEIKVNNGTWDDGFHWGFGDLAVAYEDTDNKDGNIKITLDAEKAITVIFNSNTKKITLDGLTEKAPEPTFDYYITGSFNGDNPKKAENGMTLDGTVYKATVTLAAGDNTLKVTDGTWENTWGYGQLGAAYEEVFDAGEYNNIKITLAAEKEITVIFDATAGEITFEGLTPYVTPLTYTVTVPAGTEKCYIAGSMNGWAFQEMEAVTGETNKFTITIVGAKETDEYKYACQADWAYAEVIDGGGNRTEWQELDQVEEWGKPAEVKYVLMGVNGDWTNGIPLTVNPGNSSEYMLLNQPIFSATDSIKIVKLENGQAKHWCGNVENNEIKIENKVNDNIVLKDGIYDFYYKVNDDKVYIALVGYARNVTNTYGTICLPYASASTSGATFYEVVGQETGKVYLASVTSLTAGVPYIFEKNQSATQIKVVYTGDKEDAASSANGLIGTFVDETAVPANNYILYGGKLCPTDGTAKVNAYRAYLDMSQVPEGAPQQMPGRRYIGMSVQGENETTGVEDIFTTDAPVKVIENGQLIIIRDGVKYNVQGQKL